MSPALFDNKVPDSSKTEKPVDLASSPAKLAKPSREEIQRERELANKLKIESRLGVVKGEFFAIDKEGKAVVSAETTKNITDFKDTAKAFISSDAYANMSDGAKIAITKHIEEVLKNIDFDAGFPKAAALFAKDGVYAKAAEQMKEVQAKFVAVSNTKNASDKASDEFIASRTGMTYEQFKAVSDEKKFSEIRVPLNEGNEKRSAEELKSNMSIVEHAYAHPEKYKWVKASALIEEKTKLESNATLNRKQQARLSAINTRLDDVKKDFDEGIKKATDTGTAKADFDKSSAALADSLTLKDGSKSPLGQAVIESKDVYPQARLAADKDIHADQNYAQYELLSSTQRYRASHQKLIDNLDRIVKLSEDGKITPLDQKLIEAIKARKGIDLPGHDKQHERDKAIKALKLSPAGKAILELTNLAFEARKVELTDGRQLKNSQEMDSFSQKALNFYAFVDAHKEKKDASFNAAHLGTRRGRVITAFGPHGDSGNFGPGVEEALLDKLDKIDEKVLSDKNPKALIEVAKGLKLDDAITTGVGVYKNQRMHLRDGVFTSRDMVKGLALPLATSVVLGEVLRFTGIGSKKSSTSQTVSVPNGGTGSGSGSGGSAY